MVITLTDNEALALRNLLDIAVKAGGLRVAATALAFDNMIVQAAKQGDQSKAGSRSKRRTPAPDGA